MHSGLTIHPDMVVVVEDMRGLMLSHGCTAAIGNDKERGIISDISLIVLGVDLLDGLRDHHWISRSRFRFGVLPPKNTGTAGHGDSQPDHSREKSELFHGLLGRES